MVVCIDCGNTLVKCGLYDGDELINKFYIDSKSKISSSQYEIVFKNFFKISRVDGAIISSVVPSLTKTIYRAIKNLFSVEPILITKAIKTAIHIKIDYPGELGNDLLCGAVGAKIKYGYPICVADLGTASKMYVIDKEGNYIGGMIAPGMEVSMKALNQNTSLLTEVDITCPKKIIGTNTKNAIKSGIVLGQAYMISEFARRMEKELGYTLKRVLTGGFSGEIKKEIPCFTYDPNLVLDGLHYIYKLNRI